MKRDVLFAWTVGCLLTLLWSASANYHDCSPTSMTRAAMAWAALFMMINLAIAVRSKTLRDRVIALLGIGCSALALGLLVMPMIVQYLHVT